MQNLSTLDGSAIQVEEIWEKLWQALLSEGRRWLRSKNDWDAGEFKDKSDADIWEEEYFYPAVWLDHEGNSIAEFYFDDKRPDDWKEGGAYFPLTRYTGNEGEFGISFNFEPEDGSKDWKAELEEWLETTDFKKVEELGFRFLPEYNFFFFSVIFDREKIAKDLKDRKFVDSLRPLREAFDTAERAVPYFSTFVGKLRKKRVSV